MTLSEWRYGMDETLNEIQSKTCIPMIDVKQFAFSAKLYYRNKQSAEAINVIEKAANLYAANNR